LTAEYLHSLYHWLGTTFEGLKTAKSWEMFYVRLVQVVEAMANAENNNPNEKVEANAILVPPLPDLLQVCKLMYHAIVTYALAYAMANTRWVQF
jgi:hypothetical protein